MPNQSTNDKPLPTIRAVVFDLDGLMVNTEEVFHLAGHELIRRRGKEMTAQAFARMMGRRAHEAFANLVDELQLSEPIEDLIDESGEIFNGLLDDILACLNQTELARRQFRDIARIAGLVFSGYPGSQKTARQLMTSSNVLFDVFREYDPENELLTQARREVLDQQLDIVRLRQTLEKLAQSDLVQIECKRLTPLAFPIYADHLRQTQVSSESWEDRIRRMVAQLEKAAG